MKIYVGKNIKDELCFKTIEDAKNYIKANKTDEDIEVIITEGRYPFKDTLRFTNEDKPAVYKGEGKVYFDGGVKPCCMAGGLQSDLSKLWGDAWFFKSRRKYAVARQLWNRIDTVL